MQIVSVSLLGSIKCWRKHVYLPCGLVYTQGLWREMMSSYSGFIRPPAVLDHVSFKARTGRLVIRFFGGLDLVHCGIAGGRCPQALTKPTNGIYQILEASSRKQTVKLSLKAIPARGFRSSPFKQGQATESTPRGIHWNASVAADMHHLGSLEICEVLL